MALQFKNFLLLNGNAYSQNFRFDTCFENNICCFKHFNKLGRFFSERTLSLVNDTIFSSVSYEKKNKQMLYSLRCFEKLGPGAVPLL